MSQNTALLPEQTSVRDKETMHALIHGPFNTIYKGGWFTTAICHFVKMEFGSVTRMRSKYLNENIVLYESKTKPAHFFKFATLR